MEEKKQKILLVEDDLALANLTQEYLANHGYSVEVESNGEHAIQLINSYDQDQQVDLIILDVMLPGASGIEVCKSIRPDFQGPIIMLTARDDEIDQVLGLEIGADDYLCKPVEPRILAAKIKAHLRRDTRQEQQKSKAPKSLSFDNLKIDSSTRVASLEGEPIDLSTPEFDLLWFLACHAGEIKSRDEIFNSLRGIDYDGLNRAIDIHVSHIRAKIGDDPSQPKRIKTVRGKGYIFVENID